MEALAGYERYQVLARIGSGGMADVFLGVHLGEQQFRHLVVIKRIRPDFLENPQARKMFVDEAMTVANLSHPNIVKIHDLREIDGALCIAMEYVDGETLSFLLRRLRKAETRVPLDVACALVIQACEGLQAAHTAADAHGTPLGLVHRDISPHNLMLDRNGYLKIIDFGIAKSRLQSEKTMPGTVKGKFSYLSPDHFKQTVDARSDLYALGLVFFEMLTGRKAVKGRDLTFEQVMHVVLTQPVPPVSQLVPGVPPAFDAVLAKATAKDRDQRYANAEAFAADLRATAAAHGELASSARVRTWMQANFTACIEERRALERKLLTEAERIATQPSLRLRPDPPSMPIRPYSDDEDSRASLSLSRSASMSQQTSLPEISSLETRMLEIERGQRRFAWMGWVVALVAVALGFGLWLGSRGSTPPPAPAPTPIPAATTPATQPAPPPPEAPPPLDAAVRDAAVIVDAAVVDAAPVVDALRPDAAAPAPVAATARRIKRRPVVHAPATRAPKPKQVKAPSPAPKAPPSAAPSPAAPPSAPPSAVAEARPAAPASVAPATEAPKPKYLSGTGTWSGAQVWSKGCTQCHGRSAAKLDPNALSARQWGRLLRRRSRHDRHGKLSALFSAAELARLKAYVLSHQSKPSAGGVAGVR